ncbi:hypothetical protein [Streptomyces sp. NPDC088725]|uniref:hypothetical protein n=1 Tax=Streptomyces sp. NPDC088725 TaxID=3365873 RepID=UPI003823CA51
MTNSVTNSPGASHESLQANTLSRPGRQLAGTFDSALSVLGHGVAGCGMPDIGRNLYGVLPRIQIVGDLAETPVVKTEQLGEVQPFPDGPPPRADLAGMLHRWMPQRLRDRWLTDAKHRSDHVSYEAARHVAESGL